MFASMRIIIFLLGLSLISCNKTKSVESSAKPAKHTEPVELSESMVMDLSKYYISNPSHPAHVEQNRIVDFALANGMALKKTDSGLFYQILTAGSGAKLTREEMLSVHYTGKLLSGKEFDSSYKRNAPIKFKIGQMIAGWNEGLMYLSHGDKAVFVVPSHLAYGKDGFPGFVGPDEILVFELAVE